MSSNFINFDSFKKALNDINSNENAKEDGFKQLERFVDEFTLNLKTVGVNKEHAFFKREGKDEPASSDIIAPIDKWNNEMICVYQFIMKYIVENFDNIPHKIIKDCLELNCELLNYDIMMKEENIKISFSQIFKIIQMQKDFATPLCFKLIGCICSDNSLAQKCLMNTDLLFTFIDQFKSFFKTSEISKDESTQVAIKTMKTLSNKNENFLTILSKSNVHTILLQYISTHFNNENDILFAGCVELLQQILINDKMSSSIANEYFFKVGLDVLKNSDKQDNWSSMNRLFEIILMKYPEFGYICVQNNFFTSILEFLLPSRLSEELTEKEQLLLNLLVLMTLSLNSCKYLLDKKVDVQICEYIKTSNIRFTASMCLVLGNFCSNDIMANKLVDEDQLDQLIIDSFYKLFDSNRSIDDFLVSYLSILKNLAIPIQNRIKIFRRNKFMDAMERICPSKNPMILQKLFILLRVLSSKSDIEIPTKIVKNEKILKSIFEYTVEESQTSLCRPNALSLLLTLIVRVKSSFSNYDFINEIFLQDIISNLSPSFLSTFFADPESNDILFSVLNDEHVKILENRKYFSDLHKLATIPPYRPLLVRNIITPFRRLIKINTEVVANNGVKNIDDSLISAVKSLENSPQLICKEELKIILKEFENAKEKI